LLELFIQTTSEGQRNQYLI